MAQDEDLSGLAIPGVTVVDPAVRRGAYTSAVIGAKSRLSTFGLIGTAGETTVEMAPAAVVLARSSLSGTGRSLLPEDIGNPSQAALEMAHLLHGVAEPAATRDPIELSTAETEPKVPQRPGDGAGV